MKILIDMNLSPEWVGFFSANGVESIHWSKVGSGNAEDSILLDWARTAGYVVFTHDLDFAALVALAGSDGPSVLQVRTHEVMPVDIGPMILQVLHEHAEAIERGAIVTVVRPSSRVRVLPIERRK
jgi:predicted nuclease of predicted toxin-antitoxin system